MVLYQAAPGHESHGAVPELYHITAGPAENIKEEMRKWRNSWQLIIKMFHQEEEEEEDAYGRTLCSTC